MKLALLTNYLPPYRRPLILELQKHFDEVRVLVSTSRARLHEVAFAHDGLNVHLQRGLNWKRTWRTARFSEQVDMHIPLDTVVQLGRFQPDLILTGEFGARTIQASLYGAAAGVPVWVWATLTDHLEVERDRARQQVRRWLLRRVNGVVVNGSSGARYVRALGPAGLPVEIIPQTSDIAAFLRLPLERTVEERKTLLLVGRLAPGKYVQETLAAARELAREMPLRLVVVGDGPLRDAVAAEARSVPGLTWAGYVDFERLPEWYARAGVLMFPTLGDEWGLVVNEALAAGMPVMGSVYSQAVQELIEPGVNGWHFRPDSVADVREAMRRVLLTDHASLARMGNDARQSIARLTPASVAERFVNVLTVASAA